LNSAHEKVKRQGASGKRGEVGFMCKGGIYVGGYGQKLEDTSYVVLVCGFAKDLKGKEPYQSG
jgi:hypothetical protein